MDASMYRWINRLADGTGWAHGAFTAYAKYGIVLFAALLVVAFVDGRRRNDPRAVAGSMWAGTAALVAVGIGQIIGGAIDRARPYDAMTGVHLLIDRTTDFSFPSDHATAVGAVAVGLLFVHRRWGTVAAVLAVLMAFARVYVGAHYPGDVAAGLALGGSVTAVGAITLVPNLTRLVRRLSSTPLRPLLTAGAADSVDDELPASPATRSTNSV